MAGGLSTAIGGGGGSYEGSNAQKVGPFKGGDLFGPTINFGKQNGDFSQALKWGGIVLAGYAAYKILNK